MNKPERTSSERIQPARPMRDAPRSGRPDPGCDLVFVLAADGRERVQCANARRGDHRCRTRGSRG
jgi:hypothetical protein